METLFDLVVVIVKLVDGEGVAEKEAVRDRLPLVTVIVNVLDELVLPLLDFDSVFDVECDWVAELVAVREGVY